MYIDASAIIAILNREAGSERLTTAIDNGRGKLLISPLTIFEATVGLAKARIGDAGRKTTPAELELACAAIRAFIEANTLREIDITSDIGKRAIEAAARYGKAVGHPADLNFGDCFAYACAKVHHMPLLFKGDDFSKTDVAR
ncbi:MAG: type II toxin-antitoxin system VapC family toxin [Methylocystis sp.]|nr:type II toxin-antitoxin system VapC family toxin [Methylocystis sp.]